MDAYVNGLVATPERKRKVDLTYFIWTEPYSMVVPRPEEYSRIFAFVYPYQSTVSYSFTKVYEFQYKLINTAGFKTSHKLLKFTDVLFFVG